MNFHKDDDFDEHGVLRDGRRVRVPLMLADHMQRAAADAFASLDVSNGEVLAYDAFGNAAGHRPGLCLPNRPASIGLTAEDRARIDATHVTHDAMLSEAWRRPGQAAPAPITDADQAYTEYESNLGTAWQRRAGATR